MVYFVIALAMFLIVIFGMALGSIFQNKPIKGSCGGLNSMKAQGMKSPCEICGARPEDCKNPKRRMASLG